MNAPMSEREKALMLDREKALMGLGESRLRK